MKYKKIHLTSKYNTAPEDDKGSNREYNWVNACTISASGHQLVIKPQHYLASFGQFPEEPLN